jgi:hypothetical protein
MELPSRSRFDWELWLGWTLASAIGWFVGHILGLTIERLTGNILGSSPTGFSSGVLASAGQWLVLRRRIRRAGWWVLATVAGEILGTGVGWALTVLLNYIAILAIVLGPAAIALLGPVMGFILLGGAIGAGLTGVAQWLVLWRQVRKAGWWILATTVSWAALLSLDMVLAVTGTFPTTGAAGESAALGQILLLDWASQVLNWLATGAVMVWLLGQRPLAGALPAGIEPTAR